MDSKGNFFVNEGGNERIQKFDSNWNPILMWGSKGSNNNQFCHIEHLALDKYDNVYVTDLSLKVNIIIMEISYY